MILSAARQIQNRHHALDAFFNEKWLLVFSFVSSPKTSNWSLWLVASFMRKHLSSRNPPNPPILVSLFCHRWRSFEMKVQNPHASWSLVVLSVNFLGSLFELYTPIFGRHYEVRSRRVGIGDAQMGAKTMLPGKGKAGTKNQTTWASNRLAQAGSLMRLGVLLLHPLESFGIKKSRITDHHFVKSKSAGRPQAELPAKALPAEVSRLKQNSLQVNRLLSEDAALCQWTAWRRWKDLISKTHLLSS